MQICVSEIGHIASDHSLSPVTVQSIIWTNTGPLLIEPKGTNFREIWIWTNAGPLLSEPKGTNFGEIWIKRRKFCGFRTFSELEDRRYTIRARRKRPILKCASNVVPCNRAYFKIDRFFWESNNKKFVKLMYILPSFSFLVFATKPEIHRKATKSLQWRHNGHDSVSNHQPHDCLLLYAK